MGTVSHQLQQQTNPKKDGDPKVERLEGHLIVFAPGSTAVVDSPVFRNGTPISAIFGDDVKEFRDFWLLSSMQEH